MKINLTNCVKVHIEIKNPDDWRKITDLLQFILDEEIYDIGGSTTGRGNYIAYHTEEDAKKIKSFMESLR